MRERIEQTVRREAEHIYRTHDLPASRVEIGGVFELAASSGAAPVLLVQLRHPDVRPGVDPAPGLRFSAEGTYLGWDHVDPRLGDHR